MEKDLFKATGSQALVYSESPRGHGKTNFWAPVFCFGGGAICISSKLQVILILLVRRPYVVNHWLGNLTSA